MTLPALVRLLQLISGLCWLVPFIWRSPSVVRVFLGGMRDGDPVWLVIWFMAATQLGFVFRWLLFPSAIRLMGRDELAMWAGMYVLSSMVALAANWVFSVDQKGRG